MEVCGGYIYFIFKYGIEEVLFNKIELIYGFGCLVCIMLRGRLDDVIVLVEKFDVIFIIFGDGMWVLGF